MPKPKRYLDNGGKPDRGISDNQYYNIMRKVANDNYKNWGFNNPTDAYNHAINDRTYDYKGYYNKYPNGKGNAIDHWTDEFKTVYHPTFSDESIYSGKVHPIFNPNGFTGGMWLNDIYIPPKYQSTSKLRFRNGGRLQFRDGGKKPITTGDTGYPRIQVPNVPETLRPIARKFNRNSERTYNFIKNISTLANDGKNYLKKVSSSIILPANEKRKRLYKNINPNAGYIDPFNRMFRALTNTGSDDMWNREAVADDAFATYLQIPIKERKFNTRLHKSKYKPTIGSVIGDIYALPLKDTELDKGTIINDAKGIKINETAPAKVLPISGHGVLGNYTLSRGFDDKGEYVSYYDEYNLNPFRGFFAKRDGNNAPNFIQNIEDLSFGLGKPFTLYDRIYLDDYYSVKNPTHATYLPEVTIYGRNKKSYGGSIHIAPSKRDTFAAAATRHGMGVQEFANTVLRNKDRYSPSLVKKANFARNASKWNH